MCKSVRADYQYILTTTDRDSYVNSYYPTSNFGGKDYLIIGNYIVGWSEVYLHFDLSDRPSNWEFVIIAIGMYYISETTTIYFCLTSDTWDEYTITWNNKPAHNIIIESEIVAEPDWYYVDISDLVIGRTEISICIKAFDESQTGYIQANSKEYDNPEDYAPTLSWVYEGINLTVLVITIVSIIAVISTVIVVTIILIKRRNKRKTLDDWKDEKLSVDKSILPSTEIRFCMKCGQKRLGQQPFCPYCGHQFEDNL